jgi:hypothetical protein
VRPTGVHLRTAPLSYLCALSKGERVFNVDARIGERQFDRTAANKMLTVLKPFPRPDASRKRAINAPAC